MYKPHGVYIYHIEISHEVGSASYVFAAFAMLTAGSWTGTYLTHTPKSRVRFVARNAWDRVSNRFNGEDGGTAMVYPNASTKRPTVGWENYKQKK